MKPVNLWEALTSLETIGRREEKYPQRVFQEQLCELGKAARFHMQEITLEATEEGWLIKVFGCDSAADGFDIHILIPKDYRQPTKVIKDRYGRLEYHHE